MSFKMRLNGFRVEDTLFRKMVDARDRRLHGDVVFVDAKSPDRFDVTLADGRVLNMGPVSLDRRIQADMNAEEERRAAWRAANGIGAGEHAALAKDGASLVRRSRSHGSFARW